MANRARKTLKSKPSGKTMAHLTRSRGAFSALDILHAEFARENSAYYKKNIEAVNQAVELLNQKGKRLSKETARLMNPNEIKRHIALLKTALNYCTRFSEFLEEKKAPASAKSVMQQETVKYEEDLYILETLLHSLRK